MEWKSFLFWKTKPSPQKLLKEHLEALADLEKMDSFRLYRDIIEWRIHNVAEQVLRRPKEQKYFGGYVDGLRLVLQDFRRIRETYLRKKKEQEAKKG